MERRGRILLERPDPCLVLQIFEKQEYDIELFSNVSVRVNLHLIALSLLLERK